MINTETLHQEIEQERQLNRIDDTSRETNSHKEAFSLRDEIGTCLNIEVEIDDMDKSPFLLDHSM